MNKYKKWKTKANKLKKKSTGKLPWVYHASEQYCWLWIVCMLLSEVIQMRNWLLREIRDKKLAERPNSKHHLEVVSSQIPSTVEDADLQSGGLLQTMLSRFHQDPRYTEATRLFTTFSITVTSFSTKPELFWLWSSYVSVSSAVLPAKVSMFLDVLLEREGCIKFLVSRAWISLVLQTEELGMKRLRLKLFKRFDVQLRHFIQAVGWSS